MTVRCAVCGRTILAGERVRGYASPEGGRAVCELCVGRAEGRGWRPEGEAVTDHSTDSARRHRGGWRRLLPPRSRRPTPADPAPSSLPETDPAAPGIRSRRSSGDPAAPHPFERALARFNASEAARIVAGLTRTLGAPWVSVGALAGAPAEIRITVAWELSWYQWGVDLGDELRPVFQLDKGSEIVQLDSAARQWNASVAEGGKVVLGAAGAPVADEPAPGLAG